jgi:hypothetical protein
MAEDWRQSVLAGSPLPFQVCFMIRRRIFFHLVRVKMRRVTPSLTRTQTESNSWKKWSSLAMTP